MRFSQNNSGDNQEWPINLVPMIDIIFNLLLFFVVATTFASTAGGIKVRLPDATGREMSGDKAEISLSVTAEGKIFFNKHEIDENSLSREFGAAYLKNTETTVVIQADTKAQHGQVVRVMDIAKRARLYRIAIATQNSDESPPRSN